MTFFLLFAPLSTVIVLTWVASWWRPRLRPGVVAAVGLAAGVVAIVAAAQWPDGETGDSGLSSSSTPSTLLFLNGLVAVCVAAVLLFVSAVVTVLREARRTAV